MDYVKIKWLSDSGWITDYISEDEEDPWFLSTNEKENDKYSFCLSKKLGEDLYAVLENIISSIKQNNEYKIINMGLSCKDNTMSGQFEISVRQPTEPNAF